MGCTTVCSIALPLRPASGWCRSAFLLCIIFNIVLQYGVRVVGEENIEIAVDAALKSSLHF